MKVYNTHRNTSTSNQDIIHCPDTVKSRQRANTMSFPAVVACQTGIEHLYVLTLAEQSQSVPSFESEWSLTRKPSRQAAFHKRIENFHQVASNTSGNYCNQNTSFQIFSVEQPCQLKGHGIISSNIYRSCWHQAASHPGCSPESTPRCRWRDEC